MNDAELERMEEDAELDIRKIVREFERDWNTPEEMPPIIIPGEEGEDA